MPILDHFGILAPHYERFIGLGSTERLERLAGLPVDGLLLDVGGGTGRVTHALAGLARARVVADVSPQMLAQARQKPGLLAVQSESEHLPFSNESFAVVLMVDALHHVADQALTAAEMWRVLRPGGRILIEEPDIRRSAVKVVALLEKLALMRSHIISPPRIEALFPYPNARCYTTLEGMAAWVVIEKEIQ